MKSKRKSSSAVLYIISLTLYQMVLETKDFSFCTMNTVVDKVITTRGIVEIVYELCKEPPLLQLKLLNC